jgi:CyaY protein
MTALTDHDYHTLTAAVLGGIETLVDQWLQDDVVDIDAQRTGGLLELHFPNGSTIVVNTQPPLQELWLAARSGGFHFRFVEGRWTDTKDGRDFYAALSECASAQAGRSLQFVPPPAA